MLFKSQILTQASGSVGGSTFSRNRGGMYIRSRAVPINPSTPPQNAVRAALAQLTDTWANVLTQAQRDAWILYAFNTPLQGPLGDFRNAGGLGMYIRTNVPLLISGEARIDAAPTSFTEGAAMTAVTITLESVLQQVTFALGGPQPGNVFRIQIRMSRPQSPGVLSPAQAYTRLTTNPPGDFPLTTGALPFAVATGQRVFFKMRQVMDDGRLGPERTFSTIVVA